VLPISIYLPRPTDWWLYCLCHIIQLHSVQISIKRCRALVAWGDGEISLAVNGRIGRRVACLLGGNGTSLEAIDLEGEEDGEAQEGDPEVEAD
jgi:anaphase-promoting complex subunit 4